MKRHIIIAPHADDEIIGCHAILHSREVATVAFPFKNKVAVEEAKDCNKLFGFTSATFSTFQDVLVWAIKAHSDGGLIFFPDPTYELHPDHRMIGAWGERLVKEQHFNNIVYYTTNMNAPYMQETELLTYKKEDLDKCYPSKKSLWEYDHKYFLFEGYTRPGLPI